MFPLKCDSIPTERKTESSGCRQEQWGVLSCITIDICVTYGTPLVKTFSVPLNRCNSNLLEGTTSIIRWAPTVRAPHHLSRPLHTVPDMCHIASQDAVPQCHKLCQTSHRFSRAHSHTHNLLLEIQFVCLSNSIVIIRMHVIWISNI